MAYGRKWATAAGTLFKTAGVGISSFATRAHSEILVNLFFAFILVCCSYQAYQLSLNRSREELAFAQISKIRDQLYSIRSPLQDHFLFQAYDLQGPASLEAPFDRISLGADMVIRCLLYVKRRHGTIILIALRHQAGKLDYVWSDFYGDRRLQKVKL